MTLEELYARYEAAIESRAEVAQARRELEKAEAICNEEIVAAQEAIKQWYVKQNELENNTNSVKDELLVGVLAANNEKDF